MSFIRNMNRKERRKFDRLPTEEQRQIVTADLVEKFKEVGNREISMAFVEGVKSGNELLYEKFVKRIDETEDAARKAELTMALVDEIRKHHKVSKEGNGCK